MRLFPLLLIALSFGTFVPLPTKAAENTFVDLRVPYTSQSPYGSWIEPWKNACEETVISMIDAYYGKRTLDQSKSMSAIRLALKLREHRFGKSLDESADVIAGLINAYYPWEAQIVRNPTLENIKEELWAGHPVIALTYGKALKNPRFRDGGPYYHTVVLSGIDENTKEFITEEPGVTSGGHGYRYSYETIMNALHDFLPNQQTANGVPTVLFTNPTLTISAESDGDGDGLTKHDELTYGTVLYLSDSDGDGYSDGEEVGLGFFPTKNERALPQGSLVKSANEPLVYRLENGTKRHILNETVFFAHGWHWNQLVIVSDRFLTSIPTGAEIME